MANNRIGIREFVELTVRTGDLNPITSNSNNTAIIGSQIHRKLQAAHRESDYEKEVYLKTAVTVNDEDYQLEGRADGVWTDDTGLTVEEIKTSARPWEEATQNTRDRYWAQARIYGHLLCEQRHLDQATITLVYVQTSTDTVSRFSEVKSAAELADDFTDLLEEFRDWLKLRSDIIKRRNTSIDQLDFPFPQFRAGQHELAAAVYKAIYSQARLFVQAPTGTGKTISALFPTLKAMGTGLIQRAFYLTAKQSTRRVAEQAMALMAQAGLTAKSITLTAKDTITFADEPDDPSKNPYMLGYYDRLKPALHDLLEHEDQLTRPVIETYARKHRLDPFEFSLDASLFCDVIICDYNYLFDPLVFLQRFFSEKDDSNFFLIDEAHNLVSRARDMYTAAITDQDFVQLKKALTPYKGAPLTKVRRAMTRILNTLDATTSTLLTSQPTIFQDDPLDDLTAVLFRFTEVVHDWLSEPPTPALQPAVDLVLPVFFLANQYLRIGDFYDATFKTEVTKENGQIMVKELCLDPSQFVDEALKKGRGAVLFSATLSPMAYFQKLLGGIDNSLAYTLPSPFDPAKQAVIVDASVNTTYRRRTQDLPQLIASLTTLVRTKSGNYLFFFPSYAYLKTAYEAFTAANPDLRICAQENAMTEADRQTFLDYFQTGSEPIIGFAVLGGIFAEGIDLKGSRLIGVAIISVGLPGINAETDQLRAYFDRANGQGFAYAYQLPGFNNVLQAGGRVIRGTKDVGVILLIDERFITPRYARLFPDHWTHAQVSYNPTQLAQLLTHFWEAHHENTAHA
ncbi:helicase C-terminal domain-containing protein [Lacticaseibacillus paracasei]|uniref:helicase C-terminal domain-containing protein n=1 Tax=Lacticaseibacillus paracasei TaxID=1597 RepID=UPI00237E7AEB|nr:helicase C-terminal domain-containing protein [Lacticaseibacillus paracasei]MDE3286915.1 PD-(D/E)XK nuclease family protein [Lacticaseibacillus paracasei]